MSDIEDTDFSGQFPGGGIELTKDNKLKFMSRVQNKALHKTWKEVQKRELDNLLEVIQTEADIVKMDYEQNPSNLDSGSVIVVHQDSSLLQSTKEELGDIAYNIKRKKK